MKSGLCRLAGAIDVNDINDARKVVVRDEKFGRLLSLQERSELQLMGANRASKTGRELSRP